LQERDGKDVEKCVCVQRKSIVTAAIVRIMKACRTLEMQPLVSLSAPVAHAFEIAKTLEQVGGRFQPELRMIRECIEDLIEREYVQRNDTKADVLEYVT
jgi:hypothetical protein